MPGKTPYITNVFHVYIVIVTDDYCQNYVFCLSAHKYRSLEDVVFERYGVCVL